MRRPGIWSAVTLITLGIAQPLMADTEQQLRERVQQLEAQLRTLSSRVEALERRAITADQGGAGTSATADAAGDAGGVVWSIDDGVADNALRMSYKEFDRSRGKVDLLLEITAPLKEPRRWNRAGQEVPIRLRLRSADGTESLQALTLARAGRIEPGAHLHLRAEIDPAVAAAARQVIIEPASD